MGKRTILQILFACLLVITGCSAKPEYSNDTMFVSPTVTLFSTSREILPTQLPITPIPPSVEPEWLTILYPKPGFAILWEDYKSEEHFSKSGSLPVPKASSAICIQAWADYLIEPGNFWGVDDIIDRTSIIVDGEKREQVGTWYDGIVRYSLSDLEGNLTAEVGGPYAFCVEAILWPGIHQVEISFLKSSGNTEPFYWTFEIIDGSVPTKTPLPAPVVANVESNMPFYLRAVYPNPGQEISLDKYYLINPDDQEIWGVKDLDDPAVCFAFRIDELHELGSLPRNYRDWPYRIFITIDGQKIENWLYPIKAMSDEISRLSVHCVNLPNSFGIGTHSVTIYIHPFDQDIIIYGWTFEILE